MKGLILMANYSILKTSEDKAGFIADNMEMEYDGIDFDNVILFYCRFDKTIYCVTDFYGDDSFFECYYEAANYFDELAEDVQEHFDEYCIDENSAMTLTENHISFEETIRGDSIDVSTLEDLFDNYAFDEVKFLTKAVLCDGDIKETFVEMKEGE